MATEQKKPQPKKELKAYCLHWTAGMGRPNNEEMQHYHILFDNKGNKFAGYHKPEDNLDCKDGNYARHCGGGNTGVIGVALCGMQGFTTDRLVSYHNITHPQMEAMCCWVARDMIKRGIKLSEDTVYTHAEFGLAHPDSESAHKIDIIYLPFLNLLGIKKVGDFLRDKIQWYINKHKKEVSNG